jgi:dTDP-4-dehydrorhamnose reductase
MNVILFGQSGMLGGYVDTYLKSKHINVINLSRKEFDIEIDSVLKLDSILSKYINNVVINCAGCIPQTTTCGHKFIKINAIFPHLLNNICNRYNIKLIHITTDCVYDGVDGLYTEDSMPNEKGIYGLSKSCGEPDTACCIRTSIIGKEMYNKKSLLEWVLSNKNNTINGYINHHWNGVTCLKLSEIIHKIIINNLFWEGVRHIHSPECISKYNLCVLINKIYTLNIQINKCNHPLPINRTLKSKYDLFQIESIEQQIYTLWNNT